MNARMIFVAMAGVLFVCVPALAEWTEPVPVIEVNTEYCEWTPFLSFDGLTLYFSRGLGPGADHYFRIYLATRPEPSWPFTSVGEISGTLNSSPGNVMSPWVSPDNLRMYYFTESHLVYKLKVAERASDNAPWPVGINIPGLNALGGRPQAPSLTADELIIVFSSYRAPGGVGGYDLWMATRPDRYSPFENVRNLTEINTADKESKPYISPDGLTLYFPSDRGEPGLFRATRESLNEPFGNIEPLSFLDGPGGAGHPSLSSDGTALYMIKTISGVEDIYVSYLTEPPALVGLEVVGPDEVAENYNASYKAIAYYDNDSTRDVTDSALWAVEPEATASIEAGTLTTKDIIKDASATIWASYTEGDVAFEAEKAIDIFAICPTGTALSFDGIDDYVDLGYTDLFSGWKYVTIEFWAKPEYNPNMTWTTVFAKWSGEKVHEAPAVGIYSPDRVWFWEITTEVGQNVYEYSSVSVDYGQWQHIVYLFDFTNNEVNLYKSGVLAESWNVDIGPYMKSVASTWAIGCALREGTPGGWSFFRGSIDELAIYNRALSAEEIWASMHTRLAGDELGLVGYWDLDEGEGQIVYDLSGNGNDGRLGSTADVDESDPAWVESDAPIGLCTPYLIAIGAAKEALKHKRASLEELEAALAQEWTMYEALEQWLESGDFADLSKGDIVKAKQKTHSAMQHEEQSIDVLEKGFEKLLDSLIALGHGPQPPGSNWPPNVTITRPQDGDKFNPDQKIEIKADAWDYDGSVVKVEFFAGGSKIGEDNDGSDGWTTNWYNHPEDTYSLTAKATDNEGAATTSPAVGIRVVKEPPPPPPPPPPP
jgi:hypothetical protein